MTRGVLALLAGCATASPAPVGNAIGPAPDPHTSRAALLDAVFAKLAGAPDLSAPDALVARAITCDPPIDDPDATPPPRSTRARLAKVAARHRGLAFEVLELSPPLEQGRRNNANTRYAGCDYHADVTVEVVRVKLRVHAPGKPAADVRVRVDVLAIDGRWYVEHLPKTIPTDPYPSAPYIAKLVETIEHACACADRACLAAVTDDFERFALRWLASTDSYAGDPEPAEMLRQRALEDQLDACKARLP